MGCDLCGKEGQLYDVKIEGTSMTVCDGCKGYGEVVRRVPTATDIKKKSKRQKREEDRQPHSTSKDEVLLLVKKSFSQLIREAREKRGLKQEELAQRLGMKESQLHKYESGGKRPDLETARMLERALGITLIEEHIEEHGRQTSSGHAGAMTIADMIKK